MFQFSVWRSQITERMPSITSSLSLAISVTVFGISAIFMKWSEQELSSIAVMFNCFWITSLVLGIAKGVTALIPTNAPIISSKPYSLKTWLKIWAVGIFVALELILWGWAMTKTSVANATLLANLTPIFAAFGSWLLWRVSINRLFLIGMAISIVGSSSVGWNDWQIGLDKIPGDLAGVGAAIAHAFYLLILEDLEMEVDSTDIVFWSSVLTTPFLFGLAWFMEGNLSNIFPHSVSTWEALIALALGCQVFGLVFLSYSFEHFSARFIAIVLLLDPIISAIAGWLVFRENLSQINLISFCIVMAGIYLAASSESSLKISPNPME